MNEAIHILLVDDEDGFREAIGKRLTKRGLSVSQAPDGMTGLEMLEKTPVDVVILDVKMPGLSGIDTLREIKRRHAHIQIILLTGNAAITDGIAGIKAGAFDYLTKPVEIDHLLNKIQQAAGIIRMEQEKQKEAEYRDRLEKKMIDTDRLAALGTMSTGVAHEINNPLAIISEATGVIKQMTLLPEMDSFSRKTAMLTAIEKIENSIKRARKITLQLLGHVKKQESQIGKLNLKDLLQETLSLLQKELEDKNIKIHWELETDATTIESDTYQIRQVLINLLSNAIHAVGQKGIITLSCRHDNNGILMGVKDDGIGISPKNIGKIFDPFFTTKSFDEGTGLGLFVAHKIIQTLGGEIRVESTPGKGSCFYVRLPKFFHNNHELPK
ncbi:MAG: response regulator [Proteobacteria bacterium]|nr:response regulator [Pseudomonadota bacterium]MBU1386559.1 response regulator [Pseudomonadota bacterium]MBU1543174.1 response regulator [Pseudomonadota bacterium]MBU2479668.1 response regulator [Pseudomonadota bacterium]